MMKQVWLNVDMIIELYFYSPCLILVSQSLLSGEECLSYRLSHEICHFWFGILIGPTDWTEEWFSEGFATYLEDRVHCKSCSVGAIAKLRFNISVRIIFLQEITLYFHNCFFDYYHRCLKRIP